MSGSQMMGSRKWIRDQALGYGHWVRRQDGYRFVVDISIAEVQRRLRSRPLTRVRDGRTYGISGEARKALELNGKGMLKKHALDDVAYWKRQGCRVLLAPTGGSRYLLYVGADPVQGEEVA